MGMRKNVTAAVNSVAMLISVPIIGASIWLATKQDNECVKFLRWPVVAMGVLVLLVALAGFLGALWRIPLLTVLYFVAMFLLIILLMALILFVFLVTNKGSGHSVPGRAYKEYRLSDFSGVLRHPLQSTPKWRRVRTCLAASGLCASLNRTYSSAQQFFNARLTPLQSGCCKPPARCGYTFVSPTDWVNPVSPGVDADCSQWSNDQTQLCYGCDSCKAGLLGNLRREWRIADIVLLIDAVALIWVYVVGLSAFRNAKTQELFHRYGEAYASR